MHARARTKAGRDDAGTYACPGSLACSLARLLAHSLTHSIIRSHHYSLILSLPESAVLRALLLPLFFPSFSHPFTESLRSFVKSSFTQSFTHPLVYLFCSFWSIWFVFRPNSTHVCTRSFHVISRPSTLYSFIGFVSRAVDSVLPFIYCHAVSLASRKPCAHSQMYLATWIFHSCFSTSHACLRKSCCEERRQFSFRAANHAHSALEACKGCFGSLRCVGRMAESGRFWVPES